MKRSSNTKSAFSIWRKEELGNVSKACQIMGLSRDTFYRYRDAVDDGGVEALLKRPRRAPNLKNRVDLETEAFSYAVSPTPVMHRTPAPNEVRKVSAKLHSENQDRVAFPRSILNLPLRIPLKVPHPSESKSERPFP